MLYLGVDLGTSSIKLLLMDEEGEIKKITVKEYPIFYPRSGWSEQNPEDWYEKFLEAAKEILDGFDKESVAGISFSGQMHGLVILDEKDQVIRPAILWNDGRTGEECQYLNKEIGEEKLAKWTANIAFPGFTAPKLLWLKKKEPQNFNRIAKIMLPKDYLLYRLSGVHATDRSDASGMLLLDVEHRCWSEEMLDLIGIRKEQMATLFESYEVVGTIKEEVALELGLNKTVCIVAGGGDQAVAAVGTGTVGHGMCNVSLGTSGVVFLASKDFANVSNHALHFFAHADGAYHYMGVILNAAASNEWWMKILQTKDYAKEQEAITELGENNVYFLPYLMGERSPHNDADARGAFLGMSMDTTREQMTQAVLEGVAFALRDSLEIAKEMGMNPERIRINGGGAKSKLWCQIVADVFGVKVDKINSTEGPAFGAAILAAVGCKAYPDVVTACEKLIQVIETIEPQKEVQEKYNKKYEVFCSLYPALKETYQQLK